MNKAFEWCFKKSVWVYHVNAGGCNGCDIEILDALTPYYDVERFGIKLVHTPRHADALLVAGPVTRQVRERVLRILRCHTRSQARHWGRDPAPWAAASGITPTPPWADWGTYYRSLFTFLAARPGLKPFSMA